MKKSIIISNGHDKFHLSKTASSCEENQVLNKFITGGYPNKIIEKLYECKIFKVKALSRLIQRKEKISKEKVEALWVSEVLNQISNLTSGVRQINKLSLYIKYLALKLYGYQSKKIIKINKPDIFHYRSGYGGKAAEYAKKENILAICDHSIADPRLIEYYINNDGKLPEKKIEKAPNKFLNFVLNDMKLSDYLIVNSEFVKEGLVFQGINKSKIKVIYLGIDDEFNNHIKKYKKNKNKKEGKKIKILFAGHFCNRKGAISIIKAIQLTGNDKYNFEIVGSIERKIRSEYKCFFDNKKVTITSYLSREDLAKKMIDTDIFLFPSLVEGSARVVFEAMAAGCYIITTRNSGSVVKDGVHGRVIEAGNSVEIMSSINEAIKDIEKIRIIGEKNCEFINKYYTQEHYSKLLTEFYNGVLNEKYSYYNN